MFKVNPDGMRMEPTPERVLSVCRLVAQKSMTREEIRKAMTLGVNDERELDQINKSIKSTIKKKKHTHTACLGNSLVVQWLGFCACTEGPDSIPGQGAKILQAALCGQKEINKNKCLKIEKSLKNACLFTL